MIRDEIALVHSRIEAACLRVGRDPHSVTLIAVSKTKPISLLQDAYEGGTREFGENKVQEILMKMPLLPKDIHWHMIGHLQTNKVKQLIGSVTLIHSVDSIKLAQQIESEAAARNLVVPILLEINVAKEESKYGFFPEEAEETVRVIHDFSHLQLCGFMTIAPFVEDSEQNRPIFKKLYNLYVDIKSKNIDNVNMNILSMGMTGDYEVAIEEGATMVRIGTGIFGAR
ncbi:MAG: YggS family pyridoxal phosphate-dependent enzyme [Hungatella sp.]